MLRKKNVRLECGNERTPKTKENLLMEDVMVKCKQNTNNCKSRRVS
nr:MAG TPA: hypothetical protein [Bacteriophage sp.]